MQLYSNKKINAFTPQTSELHEMVATGSTVVQALRGLDVACIGLSQPAMLECHFSHFPPLVKNQQFVVRGLQITGFWSQTSAWSGFIGSEIFLAGWQPELSSLDQATSTFLSSFQGLNRAGRPGHLLLGRRQDQARLMFAGVTLGYTTSAIWVWQCRGYPRTAAASGKQERIYSPSLLREERSLAPLA